MEKIRKPQFVEEGIMHATIDGHRFHLRLTDPTKDNFLWINGQPPIMLDQVAAEFFGFFIKAMWEFQQGEGDESDKVRNYVIENMFKKYGKRFALPKERVTKRRIQTDFNRIIGTIMSIAEGTCPIEAGLAMKEISPTQWVAPARMDLAVTYKCNLKCNKCYLKEGSEKINELSFEDWLKIYKILWRIGVPQIVFTGGEPTLREDLVRLVEEAEEFVTGLVTNGTKLAELAEPLRNASLDYVQVTIESHNAELHDKMVGEQGAWNLTINGIKKALNLGMQVITNTTLTKENASQFPNLIRFGKELRLKNMSCNTLICSGNGILEKERNGLSTNDLKEILKEAICVASESGINLQWYSPTCYLHLNPIELGFGAKGCSAAANNMTIQPDGTVLPCQSWPTHIGNILQEPWEKIWKHPICNKLREHGFADELEECKECEHNVICGGGCPLEMNPNICEL